MIYFKKINFFYHFLLYPKVLGNTHIPNKEGYDELNIKNWT
jgi:hypothetical protein